MKKFKSLLALFMITFLLTGCVKFNANMEIRKDKSLGYSIIYAFDTSMFGDQEALSDDDKAKVEEQGFKIESYEKDNYKGFIISKNFENIDDISLDSDVSYDVSGLLNGSSNNQEVFAVKKGFLKNTYTAKFTFNSNESNMNSNPGLDNDVSYNDDTTDNDTSDDSSLDLSDSLSGLTSGMDLSFNVTLPYSALSNNATTATNDNKSLSWKLSSGNTDEINFSFELYNMVNVYIACGVLAIIIVCAVVMILNRRK